MAQEERENIVRKSSELLRLNANKIVTFSANSKSIHLSKVVVCRIIVILILMLYYFLISKFFPYLVIADIKLKWLFKYQIPLEIF